MEGNVPYVGEDDRVCKYMCKRNGPKNVKLAFWDEEPFVDVIVRRHMRYAFSRKKKVKPRIRGQSIPRTERRDLTPSQHLPVRRLEVHHGRAVREIRQPRPASRLVNLRLCLALHRGKHDHGHHKRRQGRGRLP